MKRILTILIPVLLITAGTDLSAQTAQKIKLPSLGSELPLNPNVRTGVLPNGLTYFLLKNHKPEKRLELRLAVNAGSVLESDPQRGLAHFVEHMAFNGTKNFKKDELVKYLESIGTRFGADLNAYTSFDETVYMLQVPTDKQELLDKSFQILEDWAHNVLLESTEIDKERGVIIEEWRLGKGAQSRMRDKQFPILLKNSLYADRLPIGTKENLESFKHETLRSFYRDWYRPNLMAVVAVGDVDLDKLESEVKNHFSGLVNPPNAPERKAVAVPNHDETLFALADDPEATGTQVSVYAKFDPKSKKRVMDYRRDMTVSLFSTMLNERLDEISRQSNPPFLGAYGGGGQFVRQKDVFVLGAQVKTDGIERGLEAVLTEAARVKAHGFTETELERARTNALRRMEEAYNERDKTESGSLVMELVRHFLQAEPAPGIEMEYDLYKKYIPSITLDDVNKLAAEFTSGKNRVVSVNMPKKDGVRMPTEAELTKVLDAVASKKIDAYVDKVSMKPLVESLPAPSKVTSEKKIPELGVTEWTLANGVRIVWKQTDFKNDEILFSANSPGGSSLVDDGKDLTASMAASIVDEGGIADMDATALRKALTGKVVEVSPMISELSEGFNGRATPKDLRTLFELTYLYFTQPRKDTAAFSAMMSQMTTFLENKSAMPQMVFSDTVSATMYSYHPRRLPLTLERAKAINIDEAMKIYKERFADASDFTFFFVGAFDPDTLRRYCETYLGALPSIKRKETWRDIGAHHPTGLVERTVRKGIDQKSTVLLVFAGPFDWSFENRVLSSAVSDLLTRRLREQIREEKGGTYSIGARLSASKFPRTEYTGMINFGCAPTRVDELTSKALEEVKKASVEGFSTEDLGKTVEILKRERETAVKQNNFWMQRLSQVYVNGDDPQEILQFEKALTGVTNDNVKALLAKCFRADNMMKFVLLPEKVESNEKSDGAGKPEGK